MLVAQNVAGQLERRIAFRKAIKQSIQRTIKAGAKGVKIQVSGRLGGSEMSRTEWDKEGRIPLGTLRADISYGVVHARTTYGRIGVKAWVYRGEQLGDRPGSARTEPREARRPARARTRAATSGRASATAVVERPPAEAATAAAPEAATATPVEAAPAKAAPAAAPEAATATPVEAAPAKAARARRTSTRSTAAKTPKPAADQDGQPETKGEEE